MDANTVQKFKDGVKFGLESIERIPGDDLTVFESHVCGVLIVFWGALWGTFGTEYAQGFIESQLRGMQEHTPPQTFTKPHAH